MTLWFSELEESNRELKPSKQTASPCIAAVLYPEQLLCSRLLWSRKPLFLCDRVNVKQAVTIPHEAVFSLTLCVKRGNCVLPAATNAPTLLRQFITVTWEPRRLSLSTRARIIPTDSSSPDLSPFTPLPSSRSLAQPFSLPSL